MSIQPRTTLKDVAREASVSVATASLAMNHPARLRPDTVERVKEIARQQGYEPHAQARALRTGPRDTLGLLLTPDLMGIGNDLLVHSILAALVKTATHEGYRVIQEPLELATLKAGGRPPLLDQSRVAGLILLGELPANWFRLIASWQVPTCALADPAKVSGVIPVVEQDLARGALEATRYLAALGHRRIGLIHGDIEYAANKQKRKGYLQGLRELSQAPTERWICQVPHDMQNFSGGHEGTRKLLELADPPTAILYANDWFAVGGLLAASECGLRVPDELSLVGFDDSFLASQCQPPLTSVANDLMGMMRAAVDLITRQIQGRPLPEAQPRHVCRLIIRKSCAPCREEGVGSSIPGALPAAVK